MTTSPDTVRSAAVTDQTIASPSSGAIGGVTRTRLRTPRPDIEDEPTPSAQRFLVGLFVAVPLAALVNTG